MPGAASEAEGELDLPAARIRADRAWSAIWLVPMVAALIVGALLYRELRRRGPEITLEFQDATGLKPRQTVLRYRGVTVGEVRSVDLAPDGQGVVVKARLNRSAASLAREGTQFWIVRPELALGNVSGLNTIISGAYIELLPGSPAKEAKREFQGLAHPPPPGENQGLKIFLTASQRGSLSAGAPVYYRGIEVGSVQAPQLNDNATGVTAPVLIRKRYAALVRAGSKFWSAKGVEIDFSLFKGAQINVDSLKSLMAGGISFATPPPGKDNGPVEEGMTFRVFDEPRKEWLEWAPSITLTPGE